MFGNNKNTEEPKSQAVTSPSSSLNTLVKGTVVEGTLRCDSDLRVDGTIKGKLNCKAKVIIGPTGIVEGEIQCANAVVEGRFKGILHVSELLNVRETAEVEGDVTTNKLVVQSGAKFNVTCKMDPGSTNGMSKPADETTASDATTKIAGGKAEVRN